MFAWIWRLAGAWVLKKGYDWAYNRWFGPDRTSRPQPR